MMTIKIMFGRLKYFPIYTRLFLRKHKDGLVKLWGSGVVVVLLIFYIYNTYEIFYYNYNINKTKENIVKNEIQLKKDRVFLECLENQLSRKKQWLQVKMWYCTK